MNIISRVFRWTNHLVRGIIGLTDRESVLVTLQAYKSLRRLLPMDDWTGRHQGATAAHKATQGVS